MNINPVFIKKSKISSINVRNEAKYIIKIITFGILLCAIKLIAS
jgi:hypothetical protein